MSGDRMSSDRMSGEGGRAMAGTPAGGTHPHCEDLAERIERFLDGELDQAEARELDAHLDDCLPCTSERDLRARIRSLVREGCAERAPVELVARVRASLAQLGSEGDARG
jgi:mycothiol system anti-sigma-R factor